MRRKNILYPLLALSALIIAALACGTSDNTGQKVGESSGTSDTGQAAPKVEIYKVGDIVQIKDQTITLNSAEFLANRLVANFTIENLGSEEFTVSTILDFEAKDNEGQDLEEDIFDCDPGIGGTILPGDKSKGNICYKVAASVSSAKIYYRASLFGSGAVVWEVSK